jgi:co-chaperonin GroES (HSP10)
MDTIPKELWFDPENEQAKDYNGHSLINLLPKNKSLLIVKMKEDQQTDGGIFIPDIEQETLVNDRTDVSSYFGMIVAASPDTTWYEKDGQKIPYRAGDICIYAKHRETYVRFGLKTLTMVSEFDIWGIVPDNAYHEYVFDAKGDVFRNLRNRVISKEQVEDRENPENYI